MTCKLQGIISVPLAIGTFPKEREAVCEVFLCKKHKIKIG